MATIYDANGNEIPIGGGDVELDGLIDTIYEGEQSADVSLILTKSGYWFKKGSEQIQNAVHSGECYSTEDGSVVSALSGARLDLFPVKPLSNIRADGYWIITVYDRGKKFLKSYKYRYTYQTDTIEFVVPENGFYIGCSSDIDTIHISDGLSYYRNVKSDFAVTKVKTIVSDIYLQKSDVLDVGNVAKLEASEVRRYTKNRTIHDVNDMRHAMRFASYNIYGAVRGTQNWKAVKEFLQDKGIDIVGFQEVKDLVGTVSETLPAALSSWDLSTFATTGHEYGTAVGANGKFTVASVEEHDYVTHGSEIRRYTKTELYLPMYKHRWWSDHIKISVYVTQWELSKTTALAQATELATAMAADKNPFVVMMADTNDDFSFERETWQVMEDAGFKSLFDLESATLAVGRDPIDNIFVNDRINLLETNVVDCSAVTFLDQGGNHPVISDHDLIYADVQLDYSNIICVKATGTNCTVTSDNGHPEWFERDSGIVTYTITPDDGYTVTSKVIYDIIDCTSSKYPSGIVTISGNTVTVDTSRVYGDMAIIATAT